jgi:hypothetical protein
LEKLLAEDMLTVWVVVEWGMGFGKEKKKVPSQDQGERGGGECMS